MTVHVFVDESKAGAYLLVAATVPDEDVAQARRAVRRLYLAGQGRLHMHSESIPRRKKILSAFEATGFRASIFRASVEVAHRPAREACLEGLLAAIDHRLPTYLVLESDETQDEKDRRQLAGLVARTGSGMPFRYHHQRAIAEPLLAVPDAIAWAYARGGDFRGRALPMVDAVIDVRPGS